MRSQYDSFAGKGNVDTSQFGVNPFQRVEIIIGASSNAPDRSVPEYFPQIEGTGFWVERVDYPVLLSIVSPSNNVDQAFAPREGDKFLTPFKGLYLSHPQLTLSGSLQPIKLSLIVFKQGAVFENSAVPPITRGAVSGTVSGGGGIATGRFYLPLGLRVIEEAQMVLSATTISGVVATFLDKFLNNAANAATILAPNGVTYGAFNVGYSAALVSGASNAGIYRFPSMPIPSNAVELKIDVSGTGTNTSMPLTWVLK
jgi:hypothetical protein